jgi:hypothetical protein
LMNAMMHRAQAAGKSEAEINAALSEWNLWWYYNRELSICRIIPNKGLVME